MRGAAGDRSLEDHGVLVRQAIGNLGARIGRGQHDALQQGREAWEGLRALGGEVTRCLLARGFAGA